MKYYFFELLAFIFNLAKWIFLAVIFITIMGILVRYFREIGRLESIKYVMAADKEINQFIRASMPTHFDGKDISHFLTLVIAFVFMAITGNLEYTCDYKARFNAGIKGEGKLEKPKKAQENLEKPRGVEKKIQTASQQKKNR